EEWLEKIEDKKKQFQLEMDDDFNTANAIAVLFDLAKEGNVYIELKQTSTKVIEAFQEAIQSQLEVLGITLHAADEMLDEEIDALIEERNTARKNRNFTRADEIRDQLKEMDIILEDTSQGVRWKRGK